MSIRVKKIVWKKEYLFYIELTYKSSNVSIRKAGDKETHTGTINLQDKKIYFDNPIKLFNSDTPQFKLIKWLKLDRDNLIQAQDYF